MRPPIRVAKSIKTSPHSTNPPKAATEAERQIVANLRMKIVIKINVVLALSFLVLRPVSAQGPRQSSEVVNGEVAHQMDDYLMGIEKQGFAGAILLVKGDTVLLRKGYGFADCDKRKRKVTADMAFDMGSITKTITAISILKLMAEGELDINDPIRRFLNGVPPDKSEITIVQLLKHTSGLQDSFGMDEDYVSKDWLVKKALGSTLISKPGEKDNYSNSGYSLLGAIIEKASGQSYETYVKEHVLKPAGLTRTGYILTDWVKEHLACGMKQGRPYGTVKDYYGKDGPSWHLMANGGMISTVTELSDLFSALMQNKILPEPLKKVYVENTSHLTPRGTRYLSASGANNIFSSVIVKWIDDDATLVLFTNNSEWEQRKVTPKLMEEIGKLMVRK